MESYAQIYNREINVYSCLFSILHLLVVNQLQICFRGQKPRAVYVTLVQSQKQGRGKKVLLSQAYVDIQNSARV